MIMNRIHRLISWTGLLCMLMSMPVRAQDGAADEETEKRVQYQLVLPDEKTPENVKPEEHNPFESESEAQNRLAPGDTEENRVRDKLLKLPVVGVKRMEDGRMRVLLGNIILETGGTVPPVLPEQLVELRVKNITQQFIELAWQEKRATGLPPKLMIIPINISPKVRYQMLGQVDEQGKASSAVNATMDLPLHEIASGKPQAQPATAAVSQPPPPPRAEFVDESPILPEPARQAVREMPAQTASAQEKPAVAAPAASAPPRPAPAVESVVRMLFGTPAPAPK
jgi:hypothetical protein